MAFSRTWNTAYEQSPADTDEAKQGALRMREIKNDVRERAEIDHEWQDDLQGGFHKKVTLIEQAADPANASNLGVLYTKDGGSGRTELYYIDDTGAIIQLSALGAIPQFPSGTRMIFQQAAAPSGWTIDATHDDKALRIVDGSGGVPGGGADAFSSVFTTGQTTAGHALTIAELPNHGHRPFIQSGGGSGSVFVWNGALWNGVLASQLADSRYPSEQIGSDSPHTHDMTMDILYVDSIIAEKD